MSDHPPNRKSLMRALGEFVGHVWHGGVKADPSRPDRQELRREVEEHARDTPQGRITLRRTTIEEIEVERPTEKG